MHIGQREVPDAEIPCIVPDYPSAAERIVQELGDRGHRRFGYLREDNDVEPYVDRRAGYRAAIERSGARDDLATATAVVAESERLAEELRKALAVSFRSDQHLPRA